MELQLTACLSCLSSAESAVSFNGQSYMRFLHGMEEDQQDFKLSLRFRTSQQDGVIVSSNGAEDWGALLVSQSLVPQSLVPYLLIPHSLVSFLLVPHSLDLFHWSLSHWSISH